jgi:hypothetical protein
VSGDFFYQLGTIIGGLGSHLPGKPGADPSDAAAPAAVPDPDPGDAHLGHAGGLVAGATAAWLLARVLRPRPVRWTRVVIAGVAATFLADLAARTLDGGRSSERPLLADEPDDVLRRLGGGIAVAAGYAALLYPRLPGPPLLRGLAFGALEVAAASRGGLVRMADETPGVRFPLQSLATPMAPDAGTASHLAFGLGLGLFYRDPADDGDDEE